MSPTSARREEQFRVTMAAALVNLVAANGGTVAHHRLGDTLHRALDGNRHRLAPDVAAALADIPLLFTVRDGWTSPELNRHLQDACVLGALDIAVGGIVHLGPKATEYLSGDKAVTPGRASLVSVPAAEGTPA